MIITNNLPKVFYYGRVRILPGSNVVEDDPALVENPVIKGLISEGALTIETDINDATAARAIMAAETQKTVDEILEATPKASKATKEKAKARKKTLDDFDANVKAEIEAARKAKEENEA